MNVASDSFVREVLVTFVGDVLAAVFLSVVGYAIWYLLKYPGFRVGASWSFTGWDIGKTGRFPDVLDSGEMTFTPNVVVNSYDPNVRKIIHSVWVRERADPFDPGEILGQRDLAREGIDPESRTTGGDLLRFHGPTIVRSASEFQRVVSFPVFVQTTDAQFYRAESIGNSPAGLVGLRYRSKSFVFRVRRTCRSAVRKIRQQVVSLGAYVGRRLG